MRNKKRIYLLYTSIFSTIFQTFQKKPSACECRRLLFIQIAQGDPSVLFRDYSSAVTVIFIVKPTLWSLIRRIRTS